MCARISHLHSLPRLAFGVQKPSDLRAAEISSFLVGCEPQSRFSRDSTLYSAPSAAVCRVCASGILESNSSPPTSYIAAQRNRFVSCRRATRKTLRAARLVSAAASQRLALPRRIFCHPRLLRRILHFLQPIRRRQVRSRSHTPFLPLYRRTRARRNSDVLLVL